jgi:hypothetical protein
MELSGRLHAPAALLPGRNLGTRWIGGWVGPRDGVDVFREEKVSCPAEIRTPDCPARCYSVLLLPSSR